MKLIAWVTAVAAFWAGTVNTAFAVFNGPIPTVPEPATTALLVAGALAAGGLRYLSKRKRDK